MQPDLCHAAGQNDNGPKGLSLAVYSLVARAVSTVCLPVCPFRPVVALA